MSQTETATEATDNDEQLTQDWASIRERMPPSLKAAEFAEAFGRAFTCRECGKPSQGTCEHCGTTHPELRPTKQE